MNSLTVCPPHARAPPSHLHRLGSLLRIAGVKPSDTRASNPTHDPNVNTGIGYTALPEERDCLNPYVVL
jgi:hypothetical protein